MCWRSCCSTPRMRRRSQNSLPIWLGPQSQLHPRGCVITRLLPTTHVAIDTGLLQVRQCCGIEQQVIDAQTCIALVGVAKEIPVRMDGGLGVEMADRVGPPLADQAPESFTRLDAK